MAGRAPVIPRKNRAYATPGEAIIAPDQLSVEERIRRRAHAIYQQRDPSQGSDIDDWLQAEREILDEQREETSEDAASPYAARKAFD